MMGLGRERRLNCRLYVDRQADAVVIEKLDRLLVEKHINISGGKLTPSGAYLTTAMDSVSCHI